MKSQRPSSQLGLMSRLKKQHRIKVLSEIHLISLRLTEMKLYRHIGNLINNSNTYKKSGLALSANRRSIITSLEPYF